MNNLRIFRLERQDTPQQGEWTICVVAASKADTAREIANRESNADGHVWTDKGLTICREFAVCNDDVDAEEVLAFQV